MGYLDFAALKQRVAIQSVLPKLGLKLQERNRQFRGPCPACQSGGDRALVITPAKQAFYCFGARIGGDVIALASHIRHCTMKEAAEFLAGETSAKSSSPAGTRSFNTVPGERIKEAARSLQPLSYLEPDHPKLKPLGLDPDTCRRFGAGYAPKGIMRGRLAVPIYNAPLDDEEHELVAYCGLALDGEPPKWAFPKGYDPGGQIFDAHRVAKMAKPEAPDVSGATSGDTDKESSEDGLATAAAACAPIILARDPLEVMLAFQNGIENTVCFLTATVSPAQWRQLADWLDAAEIERVEMP